MRKAEQKAVSLVTIVDDRCVATLSDGSTCELAMEIYRDGDDYLYKYKQKKGNKIVPVGSMMSDCFLTEKTSFRYA